jgi:uncharacterized LabA/DUF88 family protein
MKSKEENYAFIDSQNVNLAIKNQGWLLDYQKLRKYLSDKYIISKAYLFIGYVPKNQNLYTTLQQFGYILIFKPTLRLPNGKVKGNVDAELVLHAMIQYKNYAKAVVISGDGDFYCLVDHLYKNDKLLRLLIPNAQKYSKLLKAFAPNAIDFMDNLKNKLEYKKPPKGDS